MTEASGESPVRIREQVAARHDLAHVPLTPPSATSGALEAFRRRYLLKLMVRREIKARYARSTFGLAWSYINPMVRFFTFFFVFGIVIGRGMGMENFAIHLFAGMVLVHFFTETVLSGTRSLVSNRGVVQKMAMPRELFPVASMLVSLYHTIPQLVILTVACLVTGWNPDMAGFGAAFLGFAIVTCLATGMALMFCTLNVLMRDFGRIVTTFITMTPFLVPMMYPYEVIAERFGTGVFHTIYMANPLVSAVLLIQRGFWYPTTENTPISQAYPPDLWSRSFVMLGVSIAVLVAGQLVFSRLEKRVPEMLT